MKKILGLLLSFSLLLALTNQQANAASKYFNDTQNYDLAEKLDTLVDQNILSNRSSFYPDHPLTRAELAKIATKFAGLSTDLSASNPFSDIPQSSPFYSYIITLYSNDMIKGYEDGTFKPDKFVSRIEAAKIILNALNYPLKESCCTFTLDVSPNDWFAPYTETLIKDAILGGVENNRFGINNFITRGNALRIAINAKDRLQQKEESETAYTPIDTSADLELSFYPGTITSTSSNKANVILAEFSFYNRGEVAIVSRLGFDVFINNKNNDARALNITNVRVLDQFNKLAFGPANVKNVNGIMRLEFEGEYELLKTFNEPRFQILADLGNVGKEGDSIRLEFNPKDKMDLRAVTKTGKRLITNIVPNKDISSSPIAFGAEDSKVDIPVSSFSQATVPGSASPVLGVVLSAPSYQGIIVTKLVFEIDQGDPRGIQNAYLYDENGRLLDADIVRPDSRKLIFDRMTPHIRMDRGRQAKVILAVQFSDSAAVGEKYVFSFTPNSDNVAAEDFEGDQIAISGPTINSGPMAPVQFTIADSGTASSYTGSEIVDARQTLPGSDMMEVLKIRLNAQYEDIYVEKLAISVGSDEQDDQVAGMELYIGTTKIGDFRSINTNSNLPGYCSWTFSGSERPVVPNDGSLQLIVKAKFNITNNSLAESGEATTFFVSDLEMEGSNLDIIPRLGSNKGTITITSLSASSSTTNLDLNSTANIKVGDFLHSTTVDSDKRNQEMMTVLAVNSATNVTVLRGANQTKANAADVAAGKTFSILEGVVSDPFILYDSLIAVSPSGNIYGERGAPSSNQKVLEFIVAASDNPQDPREQEVNLKYLILSVTGNAAATNFKLIDSQSSSLILDGIGSHLGSGRSRIIFDLTKSSSTKKRISEGSQRNYRVEANVQSFVADSSLSVFIDDLGNKNSSFANNPSDLIWSDGSSPNIFWVDQSQNSVQPPPLTFNSIGGGVTMPPDNPIAANVTNGGAGGVTANIIDSNNQSNVKVDVTIPKQTTNYLGSGKDAAVPSNIEVILTDANLNSTSATAAACDNSAGSCVATISNISAFSLANGPIRVEARAISGSISSGVFLGTMATKQ